MCNRRISKLVLLLLIALSIPGTIWGQRRLYRRRPSGGDVTLSEPFRVPVGSELRIAAGTIVRITTPEAGLNVQGKLLVNGSKGSR